ncbi:MAG: trehalose-phosphatase [Candidatus Omnitrophica bacterium]|nr:trehalose-phosphatase [Candidatus Omnitrophota bacterium]
MQKLWSEWENVKKRMGKKALMLFLDYDGTLTPIVSRPELAILSAETRGLLRELSENESCKIAIISGRALSDVKEKVGLENLVYVGNHGLEIEGPKLKHVFFEFDEFRAILDKVKTELAYVLSVFKGSFIEDKGLSLSLHFRMVSPGKLIALRTAVREALVHHVARNRIRVKRGKMVFEIRPPINWNKGKVVLWLLARWEFVFAGKKAIPVYIGDDATDEDAFTALKGKGLTIFVGKPGDQTAAQYYLKDQNQVLVFLRKILTEKADDEKKTL